MDRITEALLQEFSREFSFGELPEEKRFELFSAWLTASRHFSAATFDPSDLVTGDGNDIGIDSIAVIANNNLVTDVDTIDDLVNVNNYLDVTFVFTQAERSPHFDAGKIGTFAFGVTDFFGEGVLPRNAFVDHYLEVMRAIYARSSRFRPGRPTCFLYYVTTGKWNSEEALVLRAERAVADLTESGQFEKVRFLPVGADQIQQFFDQTKNKIEREFIFDKRVVVPELNGVTEAHVGFLTASDFLKLVCDEDGIIERLFYDNVRDWEGYNQINAEMRDTLRSTASDRFVLMNNGITMISKAVRPTGDKFLVSDFQVVNGCQTTHVLYENRELLNDGVRIPFRLIGTQDEAVIEAIIRATNRQTAVRDDQFFAMKSFAKKLEAYFRTFPVDRRIYYERRAHQYDSQDVERVRIISHQNLVRAVGAMFLSEPHVTTRNFRSLTAKVGKEIFVDAHQLEPYYFAGFALYRLEQAFRSRAVEATYKPARFQILLAVRWLILREQLPPLHSREMGEKCSGAMAELWDRNRSDALFKRAVDAVKKVAGAGWNRDSIRTESYTKALLNSVAVVRPRSARSRRGRSVEQPKSSGV